MNVVDWIVLGILGASVLLGVYRGFIASVAGLGGTVISLFASYAISPRLVEYLQNNTSLSATLLSYSDAATRLGDKTLASTSAVEITDSVIARIMSSVSLPAPLDSLLQSNLEGKVFGLTQTAQDYVTRTIVGAALNVICYVLCFIVLTVLVHVVIVFLKEVFKFPVLKQMNSAAGGIFGFLRGVLICFVAFALLPLIQTVVPIQGLDQLIAGSALAPVFNSSRLIMSIMNGRLF